MLDETSTLDETSLFQNPVTYTRERVAHANDFLERIYGLSRRFGVPAVCGDAVVVTGTVSGISDKFSGTYGVVGLFKPDNVVIRVVDSMDKTTPDGQSNTVLATIVFDESGILVTLNGGTRVNKEATVQVLDGWTEGDVLLLDDVPKEANTPSDFLLFPVGGFLSDY